MGIISALFICGFVIVSLGLISFIMENRRVCIVMSKVKVCLCFCGRCAAFAVMLPVWAIYALYKEL